MEDVKRLLNDSKWVTTTTKAVSGFVNTLRGSERAKKGGKSVQVAWKECKAFKWVQMSFERSLKR